LQGRNSIWQAKYGCSCTQLESCCIFRLSSLKEIGADAERAFVELNSYWEEENLSSEEKCKNMNAIRQELLV
jgi:hypothetical protein